MNFPKLVSTLALAIVALPACDQSHAPRDGGAVLDKAQAREQAKQSKADGNWIDLCEEWGWYGDGICDDFCLEPDPDCEPDTGEQPCGGLYGWSCGADEFCKMPEDTCFQQGNVGVCTETPTICAEIFAPVCGCDGQTYGNECDADGAGVSVAHVGECDAPEPDFCGGFAGFTCDEGEFCSFDENASCGFADQTGSCEPQPEFCPEIFSPVCGCDGVTYGNDCEANAAGTSVASRGQCGNDAGDVGDACGGFLGLTCNDGLFCEWEPQHMCGAADHLGTCAVQPEVCIQIFAPVCGCDGNTYSNSCHAAGAGTSVAANGECE